MILPHPITFKTVCIKKIRMVTIPNVSKVGSSCTPTFIIENTVDNKTNEFLNIGIIIKKKKHMI